MIYCSNNMNDCREKVRRTPTNIIDAVVYVNMMWAEPYRAATNK